MRNLVGLLILFVTSTACGPYSTRHHFTDNSSQVRIQVFEKHPKDKRNEMPGVNLYFYNSSTSLIDSGMTNIKGEYILDATKGKPAYVVAKFPGFPDIQVSLSKNKPYQPQGESFQIYWRPIRRRGKDIA